MPPPTSLTDLGGAGVQRVVDQLAHHRSRALDDFAGRDLAHKFVGQGEDRATGGERARRLQHGIHPAIVGSGHR